MKGKKMTLIEIGKYINIKFALELDHLPRSEEEANEYLVLAEYLEEVYKKNNAPTSKDIIYFEEQKKLIYEKYCHLKDDVMQEKPTTTSDETITFLNNFGNYITVNKEKYDKKLASFNLLELDENYQMMKNDQEWSELFYWQEMVLNILRTEGGGLWFDTRIGKYCFRSKIGGKITTETKDQISKLLTRALKEKIEEALNNDKYIRSDYAIEIVLVDKLKGINKQKLNANEKASNVIKILLFENEIFTIDDDKFDLQSFSEFNKYPNDFYYTHNRFLPTKYLQKRFYEPSLHLVNNQINYKSLVTLNESSYLFEKNGSESNQVINCDELSFIQQFIFYLVNEDYHLYHYVMNWLAVFFNSLQTSGTALVFLGDQEVTQNILWDKIIKEIFGLQYCTTLNDEECSSTSTFDIAKDKLFFHISDIENAGTQFDDITLYKIVKDFLTKKSVSKVNENNELEETPIHGQMIITAKKPFPYIKRAMSKCTIIKVNDMDTIIEKLNIPDETILEDKIQKDLDNFTDILRSFQTDNDFAEHAIDTKDRESTKNNKSPNIDKEAISNEIDTFIQAIKTRYLEYFERVKDIGNGEIYEHLVIAFRKDKDIDEGYFIGRDLLDYYNALHEQKFTNKKQLMDKLKEKDDMFKQEVKTLKILDKDQNKKVLFEAYKTSKEIKYRELYKIYKHEIKGYKMAIDIEIPYGATVTSSQENLRKFAYEDMEDRDDCIKRTEEYRAKEQERKAKENELKS